MSAFSQQWNPERYARTASFVPALGAGVLELLGPKPGERILDLGCGDGVLTAQVALAGAEVVGVDASAEQIASARGKGLNALVMNGRALTFDREFDAVFSNASLHWMRDPDAVLGGVARALRSGGRFVAELGGYGCVATIRAGLAQALGARGIDARDHDPWYFPTEDDYRERLERAGFRVRSMALFDRPTPLPTDIEGWLETFAGSFLTAVPESERAAVISEVRDLLAPRLYTPAKGWVADYVRLRFYAELR